MTILGEVDLTGSEERRGRVKGEGGMGEDR